MNECSSLSFVASNLKWVDSPALPYGWHCIDFCERHKNWHYMDIFWLGFSTTLANKRDITEYKFVYALLQGVTAHPAGERRIRSAVGSVVDRGRLQYSEISSPIITLSKTDTTWIVVQLNPGLRSVKPRLPCWAAVLTKEKYIARKCRYLVVYINGRLRVTYFWGDRFWCALTLESNLFLLPSVRLSSELAKICTTETPRSKN
jgi:hypothetical protein